MAEHVSHHHEHVATDDEAARELERARSKGRSKVIVRQVLMWTVTLSLLLYIALTTDLERVWVALKNAELWLLIPFAFVATVVLFLYDVLCYVVVFRRATGHDVGRRVLMPVKGASYLIHTINYAAAAAGMALYLRRTTGIPLLEVSSAFMLKALVDLAAITTVVTAALLALPTVLDPAVHQSLLVAAVAIMGFLLAGAAFWTSGLRFPGLEKMRTWPVFHAFERVRFADLVLLVVLRVGFVLIQVGIGFVALRLFHIAVPLAEVALYEPMVIFIRSIPLSVSGLGTTQVAMRDFYEAYASVPLIDAYSTATIFLYLASRLLIATRYVKRVMAELRVPVTEV